MNPSTLAGRPIGRRTLLAASAATAAAAIAAPSRAAAQTGRPTIFVACHPDDETLGAGVVIAEHVPVRDTHILWLTRGSKSAVRARLNGDGVAAWWGIAHNPAVEGYAPLTEQQFAAARLQEGLTAAGALGVAADHVHEAGLTDQAVTVAQAKAAIVALADEIGGDVGLWALSHTVDDNPDHLAAGRAVQQLGVEDPARWWDRRYYVLPAYWSDPRLAQVDWWWDAPSGSTARARAINACRAYGAWQPRAGVFACGYHSVPAMFRQIDTNPRCLVHR